MSSSVCVCVCVQPPETVVGPVTPYFLPLILRVFALCKFNILIYKYLCIYT